MKKGLLLLLLAGFVLSLAACDATVTEMNVGGIGLSGGSKEDSTQGKPSWEDLMGQLPDGSQPEQTEPAETQGVIVIRPTAPQDAPLSTLEYWIENCDVLYLHSTDLYGLSQEEARIARNAIYAKSGRIFKADDLNAYFQAYSWYYPRYSADDFSDSMLNDAQNHNLELVIEYESRWKS